MGKRKPAAKAAEDKRPPLVVRYTLDKRSSVVVDVAKLTLGERAELEEFHEKPWRRIAGEGWLLSEKGHAYLAWIGYRRRSKVTFEDVLSSSELTAEINPDDLADDEGKDSTPASSGTDAS